MYSTCYPSYGWSIDHLMLFFLPVIDLQIATWWMATSSMWTGGIITITSLSAPKPPARGVCPPQHRNAWQMYECMYVVHRRAETAMTRFLFSSTKAGGWQQLRCVQLIRYHVAQREPCTEVLHVSIWRVRCKLQTSKGRFAGRWCHGGGPGEQNTWAEEALLWDCLW